MIRPTSIRRAASGLLTSALLATLFAVALPASAAATPVVPVTCTPTGFVRDAINLTAAKINPSGTVTGDVDATGCNIGIYYGPGSRGKVSKATVHGANYYGIVNNGGNVDVKKSTIRDIGESPLNGGQHGIGIAVVQDTLGSKGEISDNKVFNYQKGGIVVRGLGNKGEIKDNEVTGAGPVDFIAQNGIQVSDGAKANVHENKVSGNSYTGAGGVSSGGILIFGGCGLNIVKDITIDKNELVGNDVGIWLFNADSACSLASPTKTNVTVKDNKVSNGAVNNTSGWAPGEAYQAGISVFGNKDKIEKNKVCGIGYTPVATPPPYLFFIDTAGAISPQLKSNKTTTSC
jgi:Right handed beta helix region